MVLYGTHNVIHLRITNSTALRVVIYLSKDKTDWYNENHLHPLVIEALYPIIIENIVKAQTSNKKKKETENNQTVHLDGFRLLYRFVPYKTHSKMITLERDFLFNEEKEDNKPTIKTKYKPMSIYPFQLLVSVDDQLFTNAVNTLDSYFTSL